MAVFEASADGRVARIEGTSARPGKRRGGAYAALPLAEPIERLEPRRMLSAAVRPVVAGLSAPLVATFKPGTLTPALLASLAPRSASPAITTGDQGAAAQPAFAGGGLSGAYYTGTAFTTLKLTRTDATVNFDWGTGSPDPSIPADAFSVRWTGQVQALYSQQYTFYVKSDEGCRLWVNHQLIVDEWTNQTATEYAGQIPLMAGVAYDIRLEYYENTGTASVQLSWSSPSQAKQVIPSAQLSPTAFADDRGSIQQEIWSGATGTNVANLTSLASYPNTPSGREYLTSFESLQTNWADNYGQRVRGYIVPSVSGYYTFAISGDDTTQLWLSTDSTVTNKALIAYSNAPTGYRNFTAYASQTSAPIALVAGQQYYVEALHKAGVGNDDFSVGWIVPGGSAIGVIPGDVLEPYGTTTALPAQASVLGTMATQHPYIIATPERFAWLAQQVTQAGQMQTWFNTLKSNADSYLTAPLPVYTLDVRGTLAAVSGSVLTHVVDLALIYRLTGNTAYAERAFAELDTISTFPTWDGQFLDVAAFTYAAAIGYDWLYDYWTTARRTEIETEIVNMGLTPGIQQFQTGQFWTKSTANNWSLVCNGDLVLGALAVAADNPTVASQMLELSVPAVGLVMAHYATDAGAWYEGPGYWNYASSNNAPMLAALEGALGSSFALGDIAGLAQTGDFAIRNTGTSGQSFNFADATSGRMSGDQLFYYARRFDQTQDAWYQRTYGSASPLGLLWYDPRGADPAAQNADTDTLWHGTTTTSFSSQDVVDMRSRWNDPSATFVGFKAGLVGDSHGHLDAGSFVLDALGQRWVEDLGSDNYALPGYFSSTGNGAQRWTYYRLRAEGHNTLVINPTSSADQNVGATTTVFRSVSNADSAVSIADLTAAYNGVTRVWRGVNLNKHDDSVLVQDEIEASTPAEVWSFLHVPLAASQIQISADGTSVLLTSGTKRLWIKIVSGVGAQFTLRDPSPLPTSPNPSGQATNAGTEVLAIHLLNVTSRRIAVWYVPLAAGQSPPTQLPTITPLTSWTTGSDGQVWLGGINQGTTPESVNVNATWLSTVTAATTSPVAAFDTASDNHVVPFTFDFTIPTGQQVTGARLTLGLRSSGGDTSTDRIYLDAMTNSYLYGDLGWAAVTTSPTARSVDLGRQLSMLQDGRLNVAIQQNTIVDWAVLNLDYGPTGQFTTTSLSPEADAYVRDGTTYAGQNFGTATDLLTRKDSTTNTGNNEEAYLRFNVSSLTLPVTGAFLRLVPTAVTGSPENQLGFVSTDTWTETGITWSNKPSSGTQLASWTPVANLPEMIDVTSLVQAAATGDKKLSLRVFGTGTNAANWADYGSRESTDPTVRPQLIVTTQGTATASVLEIDGDQNQANQNDSIQLSAADGYVSAFVNNTSGIADVRRDAGSVTQVIVKGLGGDDVISIDGSRQSPIPTGGLSVDGGAGNNTVIYNGLAATYDGTTVRLDGGAITTSNVQSQQFKTGSVTVTGGTLALGPNGSFDATTDLTVTNGASVDLGGVTTPLDALTLGDGTIANGTLSGNSYTVQNGVISANLTGSPGLYKNTTGKVILSGNNSYLGATTIYQGTLNVRSATALGSGTAAVTISEDGGNSRYSELQLDGPDFTISGKVLSTTGNGMSGGGAIHNIGGNHTWVGNVTLTGGGGGSTYQSDAGTLTIQGDLSPNYTSRTLTLQGAGSGAIVGTIADGSTVNLPLIKSGAGTWTLTGANTYGGNTTVNAGTLLLNGSLGSGTVTVSSGATFGASGTIGGSIVVNNGGTIYAGLPGTAGTLAAGGNVTLNYGSALVVGLAANPTGGQLGVAGTLNLSGAAKLYAQNVGGLMTPGTYSVVKYSGTVGGSVANLTLGASAEGFGQSLVNNAANSSIDLTATNALPTISTFANQTLCANATTAALPFTVSDAETLGNLLQVTVSSSNPTLVPNANLLLGDQAWTTGIITRQYFLSATGKATIDLYSTSAFPNAPSGSGTLTSFEGPTNFADNFGDTIRGFVTAPQTGNYTFWIASDEASDLWLSTDADPAHKARIAWVNNATAARTYTTEANQQSVLIPLVAGQHYYIEADHKEATGGDNISVGWQLPDGTLERPIPGNRLSPLSFQSARTLTVSSGSGMSGTASVSVTVRDLGAHGGAGDAGVTSNFVVTVDGIAPTSSVAALPAVVSGNSIPVSWSGTDDAGGTGVAVYDVYVSTDGGAFVPWLSGATATSGTFSGVYGHSYGFYSVAHDNAGNVQAAPAAAQAQTVAGPAGLVAGNGAVYTITGAIGSQTLNVTSGTVTFNADAGASIPGLNLSVASGAQAVFNAAQRLGTMTIADGGSAQIPIAAGKSLLSVTGLNLTGTATLDLGSGGLAIAYGTGSSPYSQVKSWITAARGSGGWTGSGITSSAAQANSLQVTLGYAEASDANPSGGLFLGQSIDLAHTVLVRATWWGDGNLDGKVNGRDFLAMTAAALFNKGPSPLATWYNGDYTGDGRVNGQDFLKLTAAGMFNKAAY